MAEKVSVDECRELLGASAEAMTDAEIEMMRGEYERTADVLFDQMVESGAEGLEDARWNTHFRRTGEGE